MNNKRQNKEDLNKLKDACLKKSNELSDKYPTKKFSTWDIVAKVLAESSGYPVYFFTLKADMEVIKLIAEGLSASSIANRLSISSQHIYNVAKIWGLDVLDSTLDFNPIYVYHDGMTVQELESAINEILPIPITPIGAKRIINNIEKFYDLEKFLEELENEESRTARL
jgi:predicted metallopeptidase